MAVEKSIKMRFEKFEDALALFKRIRENIPKEEFLNQPFYSAAAERKRQVAIEALLDIANALIAKEGFRHPNSYSDIIYILKVISSDLAQKLEPIPKFRNLLVHDYDEIDLGIVYEIIAKKL